MVEPIAAGMPVRRRMRGGRYVAPARIHAILSRYHGLVSRLDDQVGILLQALEDSGRAGDTVVSPAPIMAPCGGMGELRRRPGPAPADLCFAPTGSGSIATWGSSVRR